MKRESEEGTKKSVILSVCLFVYVFPFCFILFKWNAKEVRSTADILQQPPSPLAPAHGNFADDLCDCYCVKSTLRVFYYIFVFFFF